MTRISFRKDGDLHEVKAVGHADGDPQACAGVSAILCALAGYLNNDPACRAISCKLKPGDADISFKGPGEQAFLMAEIGLRQIALSHPESVRIFE